VHLKNHALSGIRPMIEMVPLLEAAAAYGKARFRVVLKMN